MNTASRVLLLGFASFLAFSIGLNLGLLGFFHAETVSTSSTLGETSSIQHPAGIPIVGEAELPNQKSSGSQALIQHQDKTETVESSGNIQSMETDSNIVNNHRDSNVLSKGPDTNILDKSLDSSLPDGPIANFISKGGQFPIALLTCNRVELLEETITSLLAVTDVSRDIIIFQDGKVPGVVDVARKHDIQLVQNIPSGGLRGPAGDGASRIASHYKFSLSKVFELRPSAPAVIVIEDDLLFSPDFYKYFVAVAPVLETDPSTLLVSAWNDNGFGGLVQDPYELRRTDYFPGLGWLLTRDLFKKELEARWPNSHWDHWLRSPDIHKGREIVYPQVPRSFHNGIKGTFMNLETHNRYFRDIAYNQDAAVSWPRGETAYGSAVSSAYEKRVINLIQSCHHVSTLQEIQSNPGLFCIWIDVDPEPQFGRAPFEPIAQYFGIWHEHRRGAHKGLHEFYWANSAALKSKNTKKSYIMLLNTHRGRLRHNQAQGGASDSDYLSYKPSRIPLLSPSAFRREVGHKLRGAVK